MSGRASKSRARRTSRPPAIEALEGRALLASDLRFAVIGDYSASQALLDVSNQIKSWNPSFVATVGDNNYPDGAAATIDANVGQYFHQFISPYKGTYGAGSADGVNHFFPALGNHDWITANAQPYLDYFTLPQNGGGERYYSVTQGNVALFVVDSDPSEPDLAYSGPTGDTSQSKEATWLKNQLAASTAKYKLVLFHQPAYSSGVIGNNVYMQWPFKQWGATAVIAGHDHDYERLSVGGLTYFTDGLGGNEEGNTGFNAPVAGSQVRYNADNGAMLVDATDSGITFQFVARSGAVVDTYTIGTATTPAAPSGLSAVTASAYQVNLSWNDNANGRDWFRVERSTDGTNFTPIGTTALGVTTFSDGNAAPGVRYTYRVLATSTTNGTQALSSGYSAAASATTINLPQTSPTYLSDLSWVTATSGYLTVQKDLSISGSPITLNGTNYAKGLGTHANSQIVYNLGGKYSDFVTDIGIDGKQTTAGTVDFQVQADGKTIYDSGLMRPNNLKHIDLDVTGVSQLTLIVTDAGDGIDHDHADFAGARLYTDTSAPTTTATVSGMPGSGGIYKGPVSVTLAATDPDDLSSSLTITYRLDSAAAVNYTPGTPIAVSGDGPHTIVYQARDRSGNLETAKSLSVTIAATAPTTTATVAGPLGKGGWYTGPVSVALTATNPANLSPAPTITYRLDTGPVTAYVPGHPIAIAADGVHTLLFQARDAAGNLEAAKSLTIAIDATAPTTTATLAGTENTNGTFSGAVIVTLSAVDPTSGVSTTTYRIDGGPTLAYDPTHPFAVTGKGAHQIVFRSRDAAGNLEASKTVNFTIASTGSKEGASHLLSLLELILRRLGILR